ncbi:MAG: transglutaminase family protein [Burkholderiales bacterium]|jgi:transglutaminase-like putative cysteine protease|nr:transglutaminase family protein [Burkholderiales bacterium]MCA3229898.1 transglutaminase family protein [Burkholderiales bacterium]
MMLEVVHETRYAYGARVDLAQHLAHLRPRTLPQQRVEAVELAIEPPPQHWTRGIDVFGNGRDGFALYAPHEALSVTARSRVALQAVASVDGRADAGAAWDEVAARCRYRAGAPFEAASEFVFESPFVPELAALRDYGAPSFAPGRSLPQAAHELMQRIRADFTYDGNATEVHTPLAQVFAARRGVCQDFAHLMIGVLRAQGVPARYVSGYLLTQPPPGRPRLVGADASHAWASAWCPPSGWIDFDPTNALLPGAGQTHVTLAWGRDYGDVMPLRGVIRGGGEHSLTVAVTVRSVD